MKKIFSWLPKERSEKIYWLGLILLFVGLTWSESLFRALTVVGAIMVVESVVTSYLAALLGSRSK